jgi:hypothetical protein
VISSAPPSNASAPTISGNAVVNNTLRASPGSWNGTPPFSYAYQWLRCDATGSTTSCSAITNQTNQTYTVQAQDTGSTLRVAVTAANTVGQSTADSIPTGLVTPVADPCIGPVCV